MQPGAVVLTELAIADRPESWAAAGFHVGPDGSCRLGGVTLRLLGDDGAKGIQAWTLANAAAGTATIDGLTTVPAVAAGGSGTEPVAHQNGSLRIDHLVLTTPDRARTVAALEQAGLEVRRIRDVGPRDGGPFTQTFFRLGEVVLEVVAPAEPAVGACRFYGLAIELADIDALAARYGEGVGQIKAAVQPGRRICTLRHRQFGLSVPVAFMSPHVAPAS